MTVTLHLTPAEEAKLAEAARRALIAPDAAPGSLAHVGASVEDLHRERQADKAREEQQVQGHG